jgi:hypothetical protein
MQFFKFESLTPNAELGPAREQSRVFRARSAESVFRARGVRFENYKAVDLPLFRLVAVLRTLVLLWQVFKFFVAPVAYLALLYTFVLRSSRTLFYSSCIIRELLDFKSSTVKSSADHNYTRSIFSVDTDTVVSLEQSVIVQ